MTDPAARAGTAVPRSSSFRLVDVLVDEGLRVAHLTSEAGNDACPLCGVTLGAARGSTRRQPRSCARPRGRSRGAARTAAATGTSHRRGASLDDGLAWLLEAANDRRDLTPDQLCDALLEDVGVTAEDDIALLVMRAHPEDRPRPATALPAQALAERD